MSLHGETVLVTGANGFIGGALVARLLQDGVRVRALVRSVQKGKSLAAAGAEVVVGDLRDSTAMAQAVSGCRVVFNVGAALGGPAALQYAVNVTATGQLVDIAHAAGVGRLVQVSSIAAYGFERTAGDGYVQVITEDRPLQPRFDHYGQSKALGERLLFQRGQETGLPVTVIRPGMVYGPGSGFWTGRIFDLARRPPAWLPGSGAGYCPAIFIDDVVDLLVTVAEHPAAVGEVFNATPDPAPTWRDFFGAYAAMAGHDVFAPVPVPLLRLGAVVLNHLLRWTGEPQNVGGMVDTLVAHTRLYSMDKAARLLDWRPQVTLANGMASAERWLQEIEKLA